MDASRLARKKEEKQRKEALEIAEFKGDLCRNKRKTFKISAFLFTFSMILVHLAMKLTISQSMEIKGRLKQKDLF